MHTALVAWRGVFKRTWLAAAAVTCSNAKDVLETNGVSVERDAVVVVVHVLGERKTQRLRAIVHKRAKKRA